MTQNQQGARWINATAVPPRKGKFVMKIANPANTDEEEFITKQGTWMNQSEFWHWYNIAPENYHRYAYLDESPDSVKGTPVWWIKNPTSVMQMTIGRMEVNCFDEDGEMSIRVGQSKYQSLTLTEAKELVFFLQSHIQHETEANPPETPVTNPHTDKQEGMRWVKASERKPDLWMIDLPVRQINNKWMVKTEYLFELIRQDKDVSAFEWLDESPSIGADNGEQIKKEKIALIWEMIMNWQDADDDQFTKQDIEADLYEWLEKVDPQGKKENPKKDNGREARLKLSTVKEAEEILVAKAAEAKEFGEWLRENEGKENLEAGYVMPISKIYSQYLKDKNK